MLEWEKLEKDEAIIGKTVLEGKKKEGRGEKGRGEKRILRQANPANYNQCRKSLSISSVG